MNNVEQTSEDTRVAGDAGLRIDRIVYLAAVVSGLAAGLVGRASPGLAGLVMYVSLVTVALTTTLQRGISLWRVLFCIALVYPLAVAPTRLIGVAFRQLQDTAFHLDAIAQTLSVGWITLAAAWLTVKVLAKQTALATRCNCRADD